MSNSRLLLILWSGVLLLSLGVIREFAVRGSYAGFSLGILLVPLMFLLSLIVGILCGLRTPRPSNASEDREL